MLVEKYLQKNLLVYRNRTVLFRRGKIPLCNGEKLVFDVLTSYDRTKLLSLLKSFLK